MQRLRKSFVSIILVVVLLFSLTGCSKDYVLTTAFGSKELMRINNVSCYLPEMMLYLTTVQNKYEAVYGSELWKESENGVTLEQKVKDMVLAKVAQVKVMNLMAKSYDLELTEDEKALVETTAESFFDSLNDTEKLMIGVTKEDIVSFYTEYAMANKVYEYVIRDVNPEISDDEARTITVQQILIKTYALDSNGKRLEFTDRMRQEALEKAEDVREMLLEEDASFESIAATYNEGDEITYTFGRGEMSESFEEAAFSLDKDEISEIIETEYGYHIIKCVSDFDLAKTQENKVEILKVRKEEVFDETYDAFVLTLTKTLNTKLYDSISMIHDDRVTTTGFFDVDF